MPWGVAPRALLSPPSSVSFGFLSPADGDEAPGRVGEHLLNPAQLWQIAERVDRKAAAAGVTDLRMSRPFDEFHQRSTGTPAVGVRIAGDASTRRSMQLMRLRELIFEPHDGPLLVPDLATSRADQKRLLVRAN